MVNFVHVFSFGIILWEMLSRKKPYADLEVEGQGIFLAVYKGTHDNICYIIVILSKGFQLKKLLSSSESFE